MKKSNFFIKNARDLIPTLKWAVNKGEHEKNITKNILSTISSRERKIRESIQFRSMSAKKQT